MHPSPSPVTRRILDGGPVSPAEAAEYLGCSRQHVYNLIKRGHLRRFKVGRLTRLSGAELRALVGDANAGQ